MKNYLIDSPKEFERLNYQNKIDVYDLTKEMKFIEPQVGHLFLDAGCGNGNLIEALMQNGMTTIHGVDLSSDRIEKAKKRFADKSEVQFFNCSLDQTNLAEKKYDHVICRYIFEHVANPNEILAELKRVLKPEGRLSIINFDDIFFNFFTKNEKFNHSLKTLKAKLPLDFEIGRKLPIYLSLTGMIDIKWEAETFFFQDERMELEYVNTRMRLEQGREHLSKYFSSLKEYDQFAKNYLEEMKDPLNVLSTTKFMIKAFTPRQAKVLHIKD